MTAVRDEIDASRQLSHAVRAAATAASTSLADAIGTVATALPATGSVTSNIAAGEPCVRRPPIQ